MKLFNEIYGTYYRIAAEAIEKKRLTDKDIYRIIEEYGTDETRVGISPKLIPGKEPQKPTYWGFFRRGDDGTLESVFENAPKRQLTTLERRWLKAKLSDRRIRLFLSDETLERLGSELEDVQPLYAPDFFRCCDRFSDGDDMSDPEYIKHFRICLKAYKEKRLVYIRYLSGHGNMISMVVLPLKIEYSYKNDKFRIYCRQIGSRKKAKAFPYITVNIGRIVSAEPARNADAVMPAKDEQMVFPEQTETIVVKVTEERNSVERFMLEFASYPKKTVRDAKTRECTVSIECRCADETELLIRLLGFGPTIEILSPPEFREKAAQRVRRQYELFFGSKE